MPIFKDHKIKHGETLERIAQQHLGNAAAWPNLVSLNRLRAPFISDNPKDQLGTEEAAQSLLYNVHLGATSFNVDKYIESGVLVKDFFYPGSRIFFETYDGNGIQTYDIGKVKKYYESDSIEPLDQGGYSVVPKGTVQFEKTYAENPVDPIYYSEKVPPLQQMPTQELTDKDFADPTTVPITGGSVIHEYNGYIYVMDETNMTVQIFDGGATDSLAPIKTIQFTSTPINLFAMNNYLYVVIASSPYKIMSYNITDPQQASYVGSILFNDEEVIQDLHTVEGFLYVVGYFPTYSLGFTTNNPLKTAQYFLRIFDLSSSPVNNQKLNNQDYLIQQVAITRRVNLSVLDFNLFFLEDEIFPTSTEVDRAYIDVENDIVAIAINNKQTNSGRLYLVDVSDPTNISIIRNAQSSTGSDYFDIDDGPLDVLIENNYLYIVCKTSRKLFLYDISNKYLPILVTTQNLVGTPISFSVDGNYVFVAGNNFYEIFDASTPSATKEIGLYYPPSGEITGVISQSGNAFVVNGGGSPALVYYDLTSMFLPANNSVQTQIYVPTVYISPWNESAMPEMKYYFKYSFVTPNGQTAASPHVTDTNGIVIPFTRAAGRLFVVSAPDVWPDNVIKINIFAGTDPSALWFQASLTKAHPLFLERFNGITTRPTGSQWKLPSNSNTAAIGITHAYSAGMRFTVHHDPDLLKTVVLRTGDIIHLFEVVTANGEYIINNAKNVDFVDYFGVDLLLDQNGKIVIDEENTGDLATVSGILNVRQSINGRLLTPYGDIVTLPNFGNKGFLYLGEKYSTTFLQKIRSSAMECGLADYRISSVENIEISYDPEYSNVIINNFSIVAGDQGAELNFIPLTIDV